MGTFRRSVQQYLADRISQTGGCWLWQSNATRDNYGLASYLVDGEWKSIGAHRLSYITFVGEIPVGHQIDHLCRNKSCINPEHLEAVTARENTLRADNAPATINLKKTHCKKGHEFTIANIYRSPQNPNHRECRTCRNEAVTRYQQKKGELLWAQ